MKKWTYQDIEIRGVTVCRNLLRDGKPVGHMSGLIGDDGDDEQVELLRILNAHEPMLEALRDIAKGEGRFSRDPLEHAATCIEDMKAIAVAAIAAAEG